MKFYLVKATRPLRLAKQGRRESGAVNSKLKTQNSENFELKNLDFELD